MPYRGRSGYLRGVKYPIKIYNIDEDPATGPNILVDKMTNNIKLGTTVNTAHYQREFTMKSRGKRQSHGRQTDRVNIRSRRGTNNCSDRRNQRLPTPEFTEIPQDIYNRSYTKVKSNKMPPFPVVSTPDRFSSDSDSEYNTDYELDTEDEEWINTNQQLLITPTRLEYIFTQLNKRNTHIRRYAIGALPEPVHADFNSVFPYWKAKRLLNKNISSFRLKPQQTKTKMMYSIFHDPYATFSVKVRKFPPKKSQPRLTISQKLENRQKLQNTYNDMLRLKEALIRKRSSLYETVAQCHNDRDKVRDRVADFTQKFEAILAEKVMPETTKNVETKNRMKQPCNDKVSDDPTKNSDLNANDNKTISMTTLLNFTSKRNMRMRVDENSSSPVSKSLDGAKETGHKTVMPYFRRLRRLRERVCKVL